MTSDDPTGIFQVLGLNSRVDNIIPPATPGVLAKVTRGFGITLIKVTTDMFFTSLF
jgi:hypothetical protein